MRTNAVSKTAQTEMMVNRVKKSIKRIPICEPMQNELPKEFVEKRLYMQSDEFLKDEHNQKMFDLSDKLMQTRDKITQNIEKYNEKNPKNPLVQAINGFSRIKKYLDSNNKLNFAEYPGLTPDDTEYRILKMKIYNQSRDFLKTIGR